MIVHVRSTKGCLACTISGMGMPELYKLNNVTVLDRDEELLSVGDKQFFFVVEKYSYYIKSPPR